MKKLLLAVTLTLATCAFAKDAVIHQERACLATPCCPWTPLSLGIVTPVALPWGNDWNINGAQFGLYCWAPAVEGVQAGVINVANSFRGVQVGVINVTQKAYGVQIGLVNVIQDNNVPFLPLVNWYF